MDVNKLSTQQQQNLNQLNDIIFTPHNIDLDKNHKLIQIINIITNSHNSIHILRTSTIELNLIIKLFLRKKIYQAEGFDVEYLNTSFYRETKSRI